MKLYNISLNNLRRRKGKMVFIVLGLVVGIATIVTLLSITESMSRDIEERLNQFGANIVMVPKSENLSLSYGGVTVGGVSYETEEFEESSLPAIREIKNRENLGIVAPKVLGSVAVEGRTALLMGVDYGSEFDLKTWWQWDGKLPEKPGDILLGSEAARAFRKNVGDAVSLGPGKMPYTVTAVLHPTGASEDHVIIGDLHEAQKILNKPGKISMVEVAAFCRGCPINEMVLQIAGKFPDAKVSALKQVMMSKMQSVEMIRNFGYGIAVLVLFVGSLVVFITMMGSVNERTREIGIFRAIGFRQGHIMQIILLEALLVGFLGGLLGYLFGSGVARAAIPLVIREGSYAGMNLNVGGLSLLLGVTLSLLASLYPAWRAGTLDPSEALRSL